MEEDLVFPHTRYVFLKLSLTVERFARYEQAAKRAQYTDVKEWAKDYLNAASDPESGSDCNVTSR